MVDRNTQSIIETVVFSLHASKRLDELAIVSILKPIYLCVTKLSIILYTYTQPDFFFTFSSTLVTWGNSRKLNKSHTSAARDGHSFSKRIINMWNSLPDCIVLSKSVDTFRYKLNKMHFSDYCCN